MLVRCWIALGSELAVVAWACAEHGGQCFIRVRPSLVDSRSDFRKDRAVINGIADLGSVWSFSHGDTGAIACVPLIGGDARSRQYISNKLHK